MLCFMNELSNIIMRLDIYYEFDPDRNEYLFIDEENNVKGYVGKEAFEYGMKLDGHTGIFDVDHRLSKDQVLDYITELCIKNLIPNGGWIKDSTNLYKPFYIPNKKRIKEFAKEYTKFLFIGAIPIFLMGLNVLWFSGFSHYEEGDYVFLGLALGMILGHIVHEFSHLLAGVYYDPKEAHEIDSSLLCFIFPSLCYVSRGKKRSQSLELKTLIAGILGNALFSGLCFICSCIFESELLVGMGLANTMAVLDNLFPLFFSDGLSIYKILLSNNADDKKEDNSFKTIIWLMIVVLWAVCLITYKMFVHFMIRRRIM